MSEGKKLDCSGLICPAPVIKTKQVLDTLNSGEILKVIATDLGAKSDIPALVKRTGNSLLEIKEEGEKVIFLIRKK
ncbi:MAG: sulfurtransferase TusA family protein [Candidatus Helarchaeota archaeon]|nr:sulfurtransferase TusA family protein [Candidatus Helarchaeota archaeon]